MILTQSQAEAVYNAMCALNNVAMCDGISLRFPAVVNGENEFVKVEETDKDMIRVSIAHSSVEEHHAGQSAFATAYGLLL